MEDFFQDLDNKFNKKTTKLHNIYGCVAWNGYVDKLGYGVQNVNWPVEGAKKERAHRLAYMIKHRISRNDMPRLDNNNNKIECSHLCHNKICVNSEHLVLEPHATNQERIHCKGQGICSKSHEPYCLI